MEKPHGLNPDTSFLKRLQAVYTISESDGKSPSRRIDEFDFWPSRPMKIATLPTNELFVRFVETVNRFQFATSRTSAKNILSYGVQLARQFIALLPQDYETLKFSRENLAILEQENPELAEDVSKIMQKVCDQERFNNKR